MPCLCNQAGSHYPWVAQLEAIDRVGKFKLSFSSTMNNLLVSSVLDWFRDPERAQGVINQIHDILDEESPLNMTPRAMFRPDQLVTVRSNNQLVPAAAERLIHWGGEPPFEMFQRGLRPRVEPRRGTFPDDAFNLSTYVSDNHPSIFISTTQPYRNIRNEIYNWRERDREKTAVWDNPKDFEYEIFVYGGIEVNRVLGNHEFDNQHEIAFPGGIRSEFIRAAREYRTQRRVEVGPDGRRITRRSRRMVGIERNPHFNPQQNPPGHQPGLHIPEPWPTVGEVPMP